MFGGGHLCRGVGWGGEAAGVVVPLRRAGKQGVRCSGPVVENLDNGSTGPLTPFSTVPPPTPIRREASGMACSPLAGHRTAVLSAGAPLFGFQEEGRRKQR